VQRNSRAQSGTARVKIDGQVNTDAGVCYRRCAAEMRGGLRFSRNGTCGQRGGSTGEQKPTAAKRLKLRDQSAHHEQRAKHFQLQEIRLREGL
jgi:hypothetical protein